MRKRFAFVGAVSALLSAAPLCLGGTNSAQAMTCVAEPPIETACAVVFSVVGAVCTGQTPKLPGGALPSAAVGWPVECPPLG